MEATQYWTEAHFMSEAFWIEVQSGDARCKQRAQKAGFIWHEAEPGVLGIPAHRDDGLAEAGPVGQLVHRAILGFTDIMGRPDSLREREAIQLYLAETSRVQHDFGIPPGTDEQTFRFISHYWSLGDIGVARKFASIAPQLRARSSSNPEVGSEVNIERRLSTLERGIRQRKTW